MILAKVTGMMLLSLALVAAPQARKGKRTPENDPDLKEMRDYRLSMDAVQKYVNSFQGMMKDPAAAACFKDNPPGNAPTLDAGEKQLNACPAAVADIKAAGLKPREFLVLTGALIGDMMAVGMKKSGTIKEYPDSISPENAAFLEQNYDKLKATLAPLMGDAGK